ncbi:MAG: lamin tail domain-containing protein [Candidatus Nanohaloarchaea archaeon]
MGSNKEAILTAFVVVSVIAIPAAAQSVEISQTEKDFFHAGSEGQFGSSFQIDFSSAKRTSYLKTPRYSVSSARTPRKIVKTYSTAKAELSISYINATTRIEKIITPYGTLVTGVRNGRRFEKFTGTNRTRVEKIKSEIKDKYRDSISELENKESKAIKSELPNLKIDFYDDGEIEYINITNKASNPVDLSGWQMISKSPSYSDNFTISQVTLKPGQTYTFYEGDGGEMKTNAVYDTGVTLYSDSGTLEIYTDRDLQFAKIQYS